MLKITLDTNILFDLIEERENAVYIRKIKELHDRGLIELRITATSASEKQKGGHSIKTMNTFLNMISKIGFENVDILNPILYWGVSFWGHAIWASKELSELEENIFKILFPTTPYNYLHYCRENNITEDTVDFNWKNKLCDAQILWCHIYYNGDIFVTSDRNFHKQTKKPKLIELGASKIMYPKEVLNSLT